jgi:hypothetical protein
MTNACDLCQDKGCYEELVRVREMYKKQRAEARRFKQKFLKLKLAVSRGEVQLNGANIDDII